VDIVTVPCGPGFFRVAGLVMEGAGFGVEVMASPAAGRTCNVLLSEGRREALPV